MTWYIVDSTTQYNKLEYIACVVKFCTDFLLPYFFLHSSTIFGENKHIKLVYMYINWWVFGLIIYVMYTTHGVVDVVSFHSIINL